MQHPIVAALFLTAADGGEGGIMSVDITLLWATVLLFVLFAWILGKFAWGPLLKIVHERETTIREQVDSAQQAAAEAKGLLAQHQEMLRQAGREREEILKKAVKEADQVRTDLVGQARADADQVVARSREQMQREKDQAIAELRAQVADIAVEAASRIVKSSLTEEAQRKLVDDYIRELPRVRQEGRA
jgi:F-type H+-transporting ATPase subunit b